MTNLLMKRAFRGDIKNKSVGLVGHNVGLWSERVTFVQSHGLSQASQGNLPAKTKAHLTAIAVGLMGHSVGLWSERATFVQSHGLSQASHDTNPIAQKTTRIFAIVLH